ncbi:MAG: hypothetical protein HKP61_23245 [Dactylosporangium sp.]|nr:hypothetical protein [Dactylosporangium sp.]NNJ63796.1 hypothetical protein [Dactylosporangium sp.]
MAGDQSLDQAEPEALAAFDPEPPVDGDGRRPATQPSRLEVIGVLTSSSTRRSRR